MSKGVSGPALHGVRSYHVLNLPLSAGFYLRGRSGTMPSEHSPTIQQVVASDGDLSSQDLLVVPVRR